MTRQWTLGMTRIACEQVTRKILVRDIGYYLS